MSDTPTVDEVVRGFYTYEMRHDAMVNLARQFERELTTITAAARAMVDAVDEMNRDYVRPSNVVLAAIKQAAAALKAAIGGKP
jgi:hypothetical protein